MEDVIYELDNLKKAKAEGKIGDDLTPYVSITYLDAVEWVLDDAREAGKISAEEADALYKRYV